ncbi:hypothetical protein T484DRAFT_1854454, partial [Baffinella frigidus]
IRYSGPTNGDVTIQPFGSRYTATYNLTVSGAYTLHIAPVSDSSLAQTFPLLLRPGALSPRRTTVEAAPPHQGGTTLLPVGEGGSADSGTALGGGSTGRTGGGGSSSLLAGGGEAWPSLAAGLGGTVVRGGTAVRGETAVIGGGAWPVIIAGARVSVWVAARDVLGNLVDVPTTDQPIAWLECSVAPLGYIPVIATNNALSLTLLVTAAGNYHLSVRARDPTSRILSHVSGSPYAFTVIHAPPSPESSTLRGGFLTAAKAGGAAGVEISVKDAYSNPVLSGLEGLAVEVVANVTLIRLRFTTLPPRGSLLPLSITTDLPCVSCAVSITLGGGGRHVGGSPFAVHIALADAPRLEGFTGAFACGGVLAVETVAVVGDGAVCVWTSDTSLEVSFGDGAQVVPGSTITIRPSTIRTTLQNSHFSNTSAPLLLPPTFPPPSAVVLAPSLLGPCDPLAMDARGSYGGGGRGMEYRWGIGFGPGNREEVAGLLRAASLLPGGGLTMKNVLTINASALRNGTTYPFILTVRNFVGGEGVASFAVTKGSSSVPLIYIAGQQSRRVTRSSPLRLAARAQLSACGAPSAALDFAWRLTDGPEVSSWPEGGGSDGATLYLPPFSLAGGGRYEATLFGSVVSQRLVAIIAGGDRLVSASLPLILDASPSYDPDLSPSPWNYAWFCAPEPCFDDPDGLLLQNTPRVVTPDLISNTNF